MISHNGRTLWWRQKTAVGRNSVMLVRSSKPEREVGGRPDEVATMPKNLTHTDDERHSGRMQADREELAGRMARAAFRDGTIKPQPGLNFSRFARPTELHHGFYEPCLCIIAQGAKTLALGPAVFRYNSAQYMVATVGVPMTAQVVEASPE